MLYYIRYFLYWMTWPIRTMFYSPEKVLAFPRKLLSVSLPMRIAILVAIFLVFTVIFANLAPYFLWPKGTMGRWYDWWRDTTWIFPRWIILFVTVVAIPIVLYHFIRLFLEGDVSPFPDIERAWKAGLAELQANGLDVTQIPLFLVVGSATSSQERLLVEAAQLGLRVHDVPQGPNPLHWYAGPDAIYLFCSEVGSLSKLAMLGRQIADEETDAAALRAARRTEESSIRQTVMPDVEESAGTSSRPVSVPNIRGTMVIGGTLDAPGDDAGVADVSEKKDVVLTPEEATLQGRRFEYLCRLIRRARQPLCPINGVLTLLPYELIERSPRSAIQLQRAVRNDTWVIRRDLKLRCPTTALVTGMESESGFRELLRRIGRDRSRAQRFGKGHGLWSPVTPDQLEAVAAHACGSFEDWVYNLFRERGSLSKPGNTKLYALLCKIRRDATTRVAGILRGGFAPDEQDDQTVEPLLFGGLYFAAVGDTDTRQAFVRAVFEKLNDQQEDLEWTQAALIEDRRFLQIANFAVGLDIAMLVGLVAMFFFVRNG